MATVVLDNMNGNLGDDLVSHTPDSGPGWDQISGGSITLDGAGAAEALSGYGHYGISPYMPSADYDVEGVFVAQSGDQGASVILRDGTPIVGSFDFYQLQFDVSGNMFIQRWQKGSNTAIAGVAQTYPSPGVPFTLKLSAKGTTLRAFLNGSQVMSTNDSLVTRAGRPSIILDYNASSPKISQFTVSYSDLFPFGVSKAGVL